MTKKNIMSVSSSLAAMKRKRKIVSLGKLFLV